MESELPEDLNIRAMGHAQVRGENVQVRMPNNNERQNDAIRKALTQNFTVIQGPPGKNKEIVKSDCH